MNAPVERALLDSDAMYKKLLELGLDWADHKAAYQALEEASKSVLAAVTANAGGKSHAAAESDARCSPQYRDHLLSVSAANRAYLRAQVRYDSLKTLIELRRSEESSRRAEMR